MSNAPEKIYLQWTGSENDTSWNNVPVCEHGIPDVEYIRADLYEAQMKMMDNMLKGRGDALMRMEAEIGRIRSENASIADSQWIVGAKFGWNCGVYGEKDKFLERIESYRKQINLIKMPEVKP
jgi:hypothetical protein